MKDPQYLMLEVRMCGNFAGVSVECVYLKDAYDGNSIGRETTLKVVRKCGFKDLLEYRNMYPGKFRMDSRVVGIRMNEIRNPIDPKTVPPNFPYTRAIIEVNTIWGGVDEEIAIPFVEENFKEGVTVMLARPTIDEAIKSFEEIYKSSVDDVKKRLWFCSDFEIEKEEQ